MRKVLRDPVRFRLFYGPSAGRRAVGNDSGTAPPGRRVLSQGRRIYCRYEVGSFLSCFCSLLFLSCICIDPYCHTAVLCRAFDALDIPLPAVTRAALALGLFLQEKGFIFLLNFSWVQSAVSSGYEVNGEKKYRCVSFPLPFYPEAVPHPCDACPVGTFEKRENLVRRPC